MIGRYILYILLLFPLLFIANLFREASFADLLIVAALVLYSRLSFPEYLILFGIPSFVLDLSTHSYPGISYVLTLLVVGLDRLVERFLPAKEIYIRFFTLVLIILFYHILSDLALLILVDKPFRAGELSFWITNLRFALIESCLVLIFEYLLANLGNMDRSSKSLSIRARLK